MSINFTIDLNADGSGGNGTTALSGCRLATTVNFDANYNNGTDGVGATLEAKVNGALSIDGVTPSVGDSILVGAQSAQLQNGIYVVTVVGDGSTKGKLTRRNDFDSTLNIVNGAYTAIANGTHNKGKVYVMSAVGTITVGTTAITFNVNDNESAFSPQNNVYVSKNGSNTTGDGTWNNPYATPFFAQAASIPANVLNTIVASGGYPAEASGAVFPNTAITGSLGTQIGSIATVTLDSSWTGAANGSSYSIDTCFVAGDFDLNFALLTQQGLNVKLKNSFFSDEFSIQGSSNNLTPLFLFAYNTRFNTLKASSMSVQLYDCFIMGDLLVITDPSINDITGVLVKGCAITGLVEFADLSGGHPISATIVNSVLTGQIEISDTVSNIYIDATSWPEGGFLLTGGATMAQVHLLTTATSVKHAAAVNTQNTFTKAQSITPVAVTSSGGNIATDASLSNIFTCTLSENTTLDNPTNLVAGTTYTWILTQGASGYTVALGTVFDLLMPSWTMTATAGKVAVLTGIYDGTKIRIAAAQA